MKYSDLFEHEGESIATMLERGKNKLNSWYVGFYDGFHGNAEAKDEDDNYDRGFRKGKSAASQKLS